ncbi:ABC transporter permease [Peptoniphilus raoultii]|uniref:ABC transporter permease n=1 Tax=Peptoniphilus raoultii TaxID=1776387 RepID=UPI0008D9BD6E|nr:ABC transporter permease subunit [Peptoniphilus raoultii]
MKISITKVNKNFLVILFWIIVWQIFAMLINEEILIVSPFKVLIKTFENLKNPNFYLILFNTSSKICLGFLLGFFAALLLSLLSYKSTLVKNLLFPLILFIKSIPVISFIILLLVFLSSKYLNIFIPFIMSLSIIYTNILQGLLAIDGKILEMARVFNISYKNKLKYIYLHSLKPYILSSTSLAIGISFKSGLSAEVIGIANNSIGRALYESKIYLDISNLFSLTFVTMLISLILEKFFTFLIRRLI